MCDSTFYKINIKIGKCGRDIYKKMADLFDEE
jgi:hypothetical protein